VFPRLPAVLTIVIVVDPLIPSQLSFAQGDQLLDSYQYPVNILASDIL